MFLCNMSLRSILPNWLYQDAHYTVCMCNMSLRSILPNWLYPDAHYTVSMCNMSLRSILPNWLYQMPIIQCVCVIWVDGDLSYLTGYIRMPIIQLSVPVVSLMCNTSNFWDNLAVNNTEASHCLNNITLLIKNFTNWLIQLILL